MSDLIPCPFCGDDDPEVIQSTIPNINGGFKRAAYCNGCFCEGPPADSDEDAAARWNMRAATAKEPSHGL